MWLVPDLGAGGHGMSAVDWYGRSRSGSTGGAVQEVPGLRRQIHGPVTVRRRR